LRGVCVVGRATITVILVSDAPGSEAFSVAIAGSGVAGLEAALALRALAEDRVSVTLLAASSEFVYRPMRVREPFGYASARRYSLEKIARELGAGLVRDSLTWVDAARRVAHADECGALSYDALILALGARVQRRYSHALTIDDRRLDESRSSCRAGWPGPCRSMTSR
jgi:sulfide:quinone oxidoreductase